MDEILELARSNDPTNHTFILLQIDKLLSDWHESGQNLSRDESISLIGLCTDLLIRDSDSTVSQNALHALAFIVMLLDSDSSRTDERVMSRLDRLSPVVVERLGDESQLVREASRSFLVSLMELKEKNARAEKLEAKNSVPDLNLKHVNTTTKDTKNSGVNQAKSSPKASLIAGQNENLNKTIEAIKLNSEKELAKEIEKIALNLSPDKDWSIRISAMQRLESLILGGCVGFKSFNSHVKHLITPFINQLLDRRSTVVKQVCHLLSLLSKEMCRDFEPCAELLIPVLFKLVVITIQVIADSADSCIKTLLCNCKVSRVIPRIIDCAKNDRNSVLRARCCEYAVLMLQNWAESSEILKSADFYENLIKSCIEDARSEVRATARQCFRLFAKIWPDRSIRLFESFDPARQKVINDEESDLSKNSEINQISVQNLDLNGDENIHDNFPIEKCEVINYDEFDLDVQIMNSNGYENHDKQETGSEFNNEINLDLNKEEQKEEEKSEKQFSPIPCINNLDLGEDSNPQFAQISDHLNISDKTIITITQENINNTNNNNNISPKDSPNSENNTPSNPSEFPILPSLNSKSKNHVPNFQRPLLRNQMTNWFLSNEKNQNNSQNNNNNNNNKLKLGEMPGFMDVPSSLNEALTEGLNPKSDWIMKVFIFNFLKSLLHHGPKGIQEITQNFDKVMKLFFMHLDDPHYKIAIASLSTLEEIIPIFKKLVEGFLERILPRIFARLNDNKELIRKKSSEILKIISENYGIDYLLPGLLRALDEQKSARAKLEILNFAKSNFEKCKVNYENIGANYNNFVKLWLGKIVPLFKDKNFRLKEAVLNGIVAVYSNYDPQLVLGFLNGLSIEEQKPIRRALLQINPKIEGDFVNFQHARKQRIKPIDSFDRFGLIEPCFNSNQKIKTGFNSVDLGSKIKEKNLVNFEGLNVKIPKFKNSQSDEESSISQIIDQFCNGDNRGSSSTKKEAMNQFVEISKSGKHLHQISYALIEMIDDHDSSVRELAFNLLLEMLEKQKDAMEEYLETLVMKLVQANKDMDMKIVNQAQRCLNVVVAQYDPLRCLASIRPLLVYNDEKLLIVCTDRLTKIISRLTEDELMSQLLSFIPALLDAFGDRSPFIRKSVLLCLVEIYLKLGNSFLPYLEKLDAMQLRLVTTYASRLSQPQFIS
ncbi:hypothetical protein LUZ60_006818 [Juncus effusus]|nr:hypothetical protein LUZ60_006818 [Juncus effusus]